MKDKVVEMISGMLARRSPALTVEDCQEVLDELWNTRRRFVGVVEAVIGWELDNGEDVLAQAREGVLACEELAAEWEEKLANAATAARRASRAVRKSKPAVTWVLGAVEGKQ